MIVKHILGTLKIKFFSVRNMENKSGIYIIEIIKLKKATLYYIFCNNSITYNKIGLLFIFRHLLGYYFYCLLPDKLSRDCTDYE